MNPFLDKPPRPGLTFAPPVPEARATRSLSRIEGMTVGDVRQCFSQMRSHPDLTADTTLWCGLTAGTFALRYLVNTAGSSRKKKPGPAEP